MYYDEFFPFYAAYADPLLYERENIWWSVLNLR